MIAGIFAKTFSRPTLEGVFDAVLAQGLACVQFNFASAGLPSLPERIEPALLERIRRETAKRRLAIAAVSGTCNLTHPDPLARRDGLRRLGVIAAACRSLGCSVVTLCTGSRDPEDMWRGHPGNDAPDAWKDLLVSLEEALRLAEANGVVLGVEPEIGNVVNSARRARRLLDELKSPRLKIILDGANLFQPADLPRMRDVLNEAFDLLGRDIILGHAKELRTDGHAGGLALGKGALDWDAYLAGFRSVGFAGPMIMHGFAEADTAASVAFLRAKGV